MQSDQSYSFFKVKANDNMYLQKAQKTSMACMVEGDNNDRRGW